MSTLLKYMLVSNYCNLLFWRQLAIFILPSFSVTCLNYCILSCYCKFNLPDLVCCVSYYFVSFSWRSGVKVIIQAIQTQFGMLILLFNVVILFYIQICLLYTCFILSIVCLYLYFFVVSYSKQIINLANMIRLLKVCLVW